jgi:S-adenosylmethionine:tRNA ribosyltransferase-isomerase
MRLSDFDFDLPEDRIALRPAEPRDAARLLVVRADAPPGSQLADHVVRDLPDFLRPGDALVFNDTRVIPARLSGLREGRTTGGLHFTPDLLERLKAKGVSLHFVTLHVGAGTFLPVKTDEVSEHKMHAEFGEVSAQVADALNAVRAAGGRIVCVGTTSLRLLESATGEDGVVRPFADETAIFITPGYHFRAADVLMTNFHLPKSTLFMLVSAFAGRATMRAAYEHAISTGYRFYSYGDGSLLFKDETS